jgi:CzcA family heavy metal efflux pump
MMRWIVGSSVKFGRIVLAIAIAVMVFGIFQLRNARLDVYPQFTPPSVQIQTEALGLSAAEIEQLITVPLEQDLLNGVPWLDKIRSDSMAGLSSIDLIFEPGTNVLRARQMVQERLSQAHALPNVGSPPIMIQPLSSTSRVMMIGLSSRELSLIDMSVLARWKIRPRLMGIPGVANVAIWGQRDRQLQVQVDPDRLRRYGVSLNKVIDTTGNALWVSPLTFVEASTPGTGGFVDTPNQRFGVQHIFPITTAKQLSGVTIEDTGGRTLRLADVANVVEDHQPLIGDAVLNNGPGLMLVVEKFPGTNVLQVTRAVEDALASLRPGLTGIDINTQVFRPASFVTAALGNVATAGVIGLVLVIVLLGGLLLSWRVALISVVTVPLSLVAAAYVLYLRGATFNLMILAGLVAALGAVVGDAVGDIDTIRRRLREHRASGDSRSTVAVVVDAALEVRGPLVYATLIILLAALPVLAQTGVAGAFTAPLVVSYSLAVLASMVVSLTLTPVLAVMLLSRTRPERRSGSLMRWAPVRWAPVRWAPVRWAQRGLDRGIRGSLGRPRRAYAALAVLALAGLAVIPQLGSRSLLPVPQDRDLLVQLQTAPGTSLPEMDRITAAVTRELRTVPGVRTVGAHVGRAVASDQVVNVNSGELWLSITASADYGMTTTAIQHVISSYPGLRHTLLTYPEERLRAAQAAQASHPLVVRVYGQDLQVLRAQAEKVRRTLATVNGVVNPRVQTQAEEPTLQIEVKLAAAQRYGIRPGDVRRAAATLLAGLPVGSLYEQQQIFDVVVWGASVARHSLDSVQNLPIDTADGGHVRLRDVADVRIRPYPTVITHDDVSRSIDVAADVNGRALSSVLGDVKGRVQALAFPFEYHAEVFGDLATQQGSVRRTLAFVLAAAIGIFLLLQAASRSWRTGALLFCTLPLAGVGGVLAAYLAGGVMSLGAVVGLLAVLGIAVRGNLLLVRGYQRLGEQGVRPSAELVLRGTRERVAPTVLTALATAAALVPFVLLGSVAGTEVLHPLAVVVLGGLVTSTLLTLLVLPALYLRLAPASPEPTEPTASYQPATG